MSELAFNANGEGFEVPATVTGWRVRRMKPRGAPELVYGKDGRPLTIGIESDIDELRDAVGTPARPTTTSTTRTGSPRSIASAAPMARSTPRSATTRPDGSRASRIRRTSRPRTTATCSAGSAR